MEHAFKIIVCGGRDYGYRRNEKTSKKERYQPEIDRIFNTLDRIRLAIGRPLVIIQGGADGVDLFAKEWAHSRGVPVEEYKAEWDTYGKRAGYLRNARMLEEGNPKAVVAFPGGKGTSMMVSLARKRAYH